MRFAGRFILSFMFVVTVLSGPARSAPDPQEKADKFRVNLFSMPYDSSGRGEKHRHMKKNRPLRAGENITLGFRITEAGQGMEGLRPVGWLTPREAGEGKPDQKHCEDKVKRLLRGAVSEGGFSLNGFYIITMNADNSIAIINPMMNVGSTNILSVIGLKGRPGGWTLDQRSGLLYVTLPETGEVAIVNMDTLALKGYVKVGTGPKAIQKQPKGVFVWIANEGDGTVSILDGPGERVVETLSVGEGAIDLTFDDEGRRAFVATEGDGRITFIDANRFKKIGEIRAGKGGVGFSYSALNQSLYISMEKSREIAVLSTETWRVTKRVPVAMGVESLHLTPDGKTLFALNRGMKQVTLIDTTRNEIIKALATKGEPDHLLFTDGFAYIRNRESVDVTLIPLAQIGHPEILAPIAIPVGVEVPGQQVKTLGLSPMAVMPNQPGTLITNPSDGVIFFYMEGMNAPMKSFKTYTDAPQGLLVYDRSIKEGKRNGSYQTVIRLKEGGVYDIPFLLETPRMVTCFELSVEADPNRPVKKRPPVFDGRFADGDFRPGERSKIRFQLQDAKDGQAMAGLKTVTLLSFLSGKGWQVRSHAVEVEKGFYEAEVTFPREGTYHLLVSVPSLGFRFGDIKHKLTTVGMDRVTMRNKEAR